MYNTDHSYLTGTDMRQACACFEWYLKRRFGQTCRLRH